MIARAPGSCAEGSRGGQGRLLPFTQSCFRTALPPRALPGLIDEVEKRHILQTLEHTDWNKSQAAGILKNERSTLDRKIKAYELKR